MWRDSGDRFYSNVEFNRCVVLYAAAFDKAIVDESLGRQRTSRAFRACVYSTGSRLVIGKKRLPLDLGFLPEL